jgi:hypothetical protein
MESTRFVRPHPLPVPPLSCGAAAEMRLFWSPASDVNGVQNGLLINPTHYGAAIHLPTIP